MVYKLLISFTTDPEHPTQNESFSLKLKLKNIGETTFPGGTVELLRIRYMNFGELTQSITKQPEVPEILVNDEWELIDSFKAIIDGLAWIDFKIASSEEEQIQYLQTEGGTTFDLWEMPFYIKNRDSNEIILLLNQILEKLENFRTREE